MNRICNFADSYLLFNLIFCKEAGAVYQTFISLLKIHLQGKGGCLICIAHWTSLPPLVTVIITHYCLLSGQPPCPSKRMSYVNVLKGLGASERASGQSTWEREAAKSERTPARP